MGSIHQGIGDCPVSYGSGAAAMCTVPYEPDPIPCSELSTCDSLTGAVHFEYMQPSGASNPGITEVDPATGLVISAGPGSSLTPGENVNQAITINPATGQYWSAAALQAAPPPSASPSGNQPAPAGGGTTQAQLSQAAKLGPANLSAQPVAQFSLSNWLTETTFDSIPNWVLLAGVAGILLMMTRHR